LRDTKYYFFSQFLLELNLKVVDPKDLITKVLENKNLAEFVDLKSVKKENGQVEYRLEVVLQVRDLFMVCLRRNSLCSITVGITGPFRAYESH
jgi:hypothetical protein